MKLISDEEWEAQFENRQKEQEIFAIKIWFNNYYTQHEQKYNRLIALNKLDDNGENPSTLLNALFEEAEVKRKRIQELEQITSMYE